MIRHGQGGARLRWLFGAREMMQAASMMHGRHPGGAQRLLNHEVRPSAAIARMPQPMHAMCPLCPHQCLLSVRRCVENPPLESNAKLQKGVMDTYFSLVSTSTSAMHQRCRGRRARGDFSSMAQQPWGALDCVTV